MKTREDGDPGHSRQGGDKDCDQLIIDSGKDRQYERGSKCASRNSLIWSQPLLNSWKCERTDYRTSADGAKQLTIKRRTTGEQFACNQRQHGPIGTGEGKEGRRPDQSRAQRLAVGDLAPAGDNARCDMLRWQFVL